jgi:hypothetical protein
MLGAEPRPVERGARLVRPWELWVLRQCDEGCLFSIGLYGYFMCVCQEGEKEGDGDGDEVISRDRMCP